MMALVDEAHHLTGTLLSPHEWLQDLSRVTIMPATLPQELFDKLPVDHISKVPFSKG